MKMEALEAAGEVAQGAGVDSTTWTLTRSGGRASSREPGAQGWEAPREGRRKDREVNVIAGVHVATAQYISKLSHRLTKIMRVWTGP